MKMKMKKKKKKKKKEAAIHFEGDTNVEDLYSEGEESEVEEVAEENFIAEKKFVLRPGPTTRSHHEPNEGEVNPHLMKVAALMIWVTVMMMDMYRNFPLLVGRRGG